MRNKQASFKQRSVAERNRARLEEALERSPELDAKLEMKTRDGWDKSVPITLIYDSNGSHKIMRSRTIGDEIAAHARSAAYSPSTSAIRMANALRIEQILGTGQFRSAADLARKLGMSRKLIGDLLAMLNLPVAEIERLLFDTRG